MLSGLPLFPTQASSIAPEVDNLYFAILSITAFFAVVVAVAVVRQPGWLRSSAVRVAHQDPRTSPKSQPRLKTDRRY